MVRRIALAAALAAAVAADPAAAAPARPQRILSMNQCTDLLLLQLVPQERIAALTYLARDGAKEVLPGVEVRAAVNFGTPEDILKFRPDLIVADRFSTPVTRRLARQVGARILEVDGARSFAEIRLTLRRLGAATGESARAERLIARMDAKLAALAGRPPPAAYRIVAWSGGAVPGRDTLTNAIVQAAGATNIAAGPGESYVAYDAEQVLTARPQALLLGASVRPGLRSEEGQQRIARRIWAGRRILHDEVAYTCGLPQSADAAVELRRALDSLP